MRSFWDIAFALHMTSHLLLGMAGTHTAPVCLSSLLPLSFPYHFLSLPFFYTHVCLPPLFVHICPSLSFSLSPSLLLPSAPALPACQGREENICTYFLATCPLLHTHNPLCLSSHFCWEDLYVSFLAGRQAVAPPTPFRPHAPCLAGEGSGSLALQVGSQGSVSLCCIHTAHTFLSVLWLFALDMCVSITPIGTVVGMAWHGNILLLHLLYFAFLTHACRTPFSHLEATSSCVFVLCEEKKACTTACLWRGRDSFSLSYLLNGRQACPLPQQKKNSWYSSTSCILFSFFPPLYPHLLSIYLYLSLSFFFFFFAFCILPYPLPFPPPL